MDIKTQKRKKAPTVAPGMEQDPRGEDATREDKEKGNVTTVKRLVWDENDPS
ncbi:hypothetical protein [Petroclostridium sp. X23]|jgi:hypothetical protein|uniref:hypothetical protein n=1 Tax=Petroclostridium sp. X23 TaxID=3045146 RepID=UPI0024AC90AC|nr:hypothetical protein [Petroclostridium sp. X23]WHH56989.1 hypothetical protein QKW49_14145 [Petroclostridium sp. X23]